MGSLKIEAGIEEIKGNIAKPVPDYAGQGVALDAIRSTFVFTMDKKIYLTRVDIEKNLPS